MFQISHLRALSGPMWVTGLMALATPVLADEQLAFGGYLRPTESSTPQELTLPLPASFTATTRKDWGEFRVTNLTTNETFVMPVYPHYPVSAGVQTMPLTTLENDNKTYIVPIDLTGRGVSDLIIGREGWGSWEVYSNGNRLSKSFDGFVRGLISKGDETLKGLILAANCHDLLVDNNLLGAVGDFLGNGTEQLAYFRPGWGGIQLVGQHGKTEIPADLRGIPADKDGDRQHFLFTFKADKPGQRSRLAYHRRGETRLLVFNLEDGRFQRKELETKPNWNLLNQYQPNPL